MSGPEINSWTMVYPEWDPDLEPTREALTTLGNGYFAVRGALETASAGGPHYPGTYLAGGYNALDSEIAGRTIRNEDLVNWPNWLATTFRIEDGPWFDLADVDLTDYTCELDLRRGMLRRALRFRDARGRQTLFKSRRIVHMGQMHLGALEWTLVPENWSGRLEIRSALDGRVRNEGVKRYRDLNSQHLDTPETHVADEDIIRLVVGTTQSRLRMAQAARTRLYTRGHHETPRRQPRRALGWIAQDLAVDVDRGEPLRLEKIAAVYTSRDEAISNPDDEALKDAREADDFEHLLDSHIRHWRHIWDRFDMEVNGPNRAQGILRLHTFHQVQTTSPNTLDLDVGVPSRGWHGEAYRGHIFWDELFIFPFLNLRLPELTRSLLMYRFRRLDEARRLAREAGHDGAMYPWQSGSNGSEESQVVHLNPHTGEWVPDNTYKQRHINAAIVYNVWQYHQTTGDIDFLAYHGAEMILEIARFWASLARYDDQRGRYTICGVVGPDEFHTKYPDTDELGLNNNAYTNVMASWCLQRAADVLDAIPDRRRRELMEDLGIGDETLEHFDRISRKLFVPFHDGGIISQFEGYEQLEEFDWDRYRREYGDIQRLDRILPAENDTPNRYKASKQADVLMLFYLFTAEELAALFEHLGYELDPDWIPRNVDYYERRSSHGSTLSRVVHSWVLSRSDRERSWGLFHDALQSDVADIQGGTTAEGIHLGAMAGTLDLVQRCYAGVNIGSGVLYLDPCLPDELEQLTMRIRYRDEWMYLRINHEVMEVVAETRKAGPVTIAHAGERHSLAPGERRVFHLPAR
ncbi:MAG: glycoside hydrolase family 65 protein [Planctomycetota bacterium]